MSPLVVDLRQVTFMDSTALAVLVNARKRLEAVGGLAVVCEAGPALRVLQMIRAETLFAICRSVDEAVDRVG